MRRLILLMSLPLLALGITRLLMPATLFGFAGLDVPFAVLGLSVVLAYGVLSSPARRNISFNSLFLLAALICFGFTLIGLWDPTLGGKRATYLPLMDLFVTLESGLLLTIAATEKKPGALPLLTALGIAVQLAFRKLHATRLATTATPLSHSYSGRGLRHRATY